MTHDLFVWVDEQLAAHLVHDPAEDHWALAYGDTFQPEAVSAFDWADFASRCGIDRQVLRREGQRLAKRAPHAAQAQAASAVYQPEEQAFLQGVVAFVTQQAQRLAALVTGAGAIRAEYL